MKLRLGHRDQEPAKDRPPTPTSLSRWREGFRCQRFDHSPNSADCECRWCCTHLQKTHCKASAVTASDTRIVTAGSLPFASRVEPPLLRWVLYRATAPSVVWLRGNAHGELPGLYQVERGEGSFCKASGRACPKERHHRPTCRPGRPTGRAC
jgi:hypothetical protein